MKTARFLQKLANREFRHFFLEDMVKGWVSLQIKQLRKDRGWTQEDLGEASDKAQSTIARFESEDYGNWSTRSLLELAEAFDVAIEIRFVSWPTFLDGIEDTSPEKMSVSSFPSSDFDAA